MAAQTPAAAQDVPPEDYIAAALVFSAKLGHHFSLATLPPRYLAGPAGTAHDHAAAPPSQPYLRGHRLRDYFVLDELTVVSTATVVAVAA